MRPSRAASCRRWIRASAEALLDRITQVEVFERFLHRTFPGKTRFSIEGLDMLVPILDEIMICGAADTGARHTMIGMAHRGRLNVLAHILEKPYAQILAEFKDPVAAPIAAARPRMDGRREVSRRRPHRGAARARCTSTMPPNPSHLEAVNPVVVGMARAAGTLADRARRRRISTARITLPVLIHGDAAFPGQGIVAETLNLSRLDRLRHRRHDPHHREQPARLHGHARRVLQHQLRERPGPRLQDSRSSTSTPTIRPPASRPRGWRGSTARASGATS